MKGARVTREVTHEKAVWHLVLDGPPANIVSGTTCDELRDGLAAAAASPEAKLVVVRGAGSHFSYGASIEEHLPEHAPAMIAGLHATVRALVECPLPTLALVRGRCFGGGLELALSCGMLFVEEEAVLGQPEIRLGVFAPAATALLAGQVPWAIAEEILVTGRDFGAQEALQWGLANRLVPEGRMAEHLDALVDTVLLPRSASSLRLAVRALRAHRLAEVSPRLDAAEALYVKELLATHDGSEGIRAFLEKRAPRWENR